MKHSRCFVGAGATGGRLYFGVQSGGKSQHNGLYLVIDKKSNGTAGVIDGGLTLASGVKAAILGNAHATAGLRRGTFTIFGHIGDGKTDDRRFTGSWNCG